MIKIWSHCLWDGSLGTKSPEVTPGGGQFGWSPLLSQSGFPTQVDLEHVGTGVGDLIRVPYSLRVKRHVYRTRVKVPDLSGEGVQVERFPSSVVVTPGESSSPLFSVDKPLHFPRTCTLDPPGTKMCFGERYVCLGRHPSLLPPDISNSVERTTTSVTSS